MRHHTYDERDYAFGQTIVTMRTAMNLTQVELARFLGVSRGAVLGWEARLILSVNRFLPRLVDRVLARKVRQWYGDETAGG